jgi:hypothetical protein
MFDTASAIFIIYPRLIFIALLLLIPRHSLAIELTTMDQLCRYYVGRPLGVKDGKPANITCDNLEVGNIQLQRAMPKPVFRDFRDSLRRHQEKNFEMAILNDPGFKGKCTKKDSDQSRKYRCEFPPGLDSITEFTIGNTGKVEKAELNVSRSILRPATLNILARLGISEATEAYSEIVLYLVVINSRQLSFPDELYSTDGQTLKVEIWPSRLP